MIENSLTYQFKNGSAGTDYGPDALVLTLTDGTSIKYVPETKVVTPGPVFKPGQIVLFGVNTAFKDRYGVVTNVGALYVTVDIGEDFHPKMLPHNLELIHEVE